MLLRDRDDALNLEVLVVDLDHVTDANVRDLPDADAVDERAIAPLVEEDDVVFGGLELVLAFRMRSFKNSVERQLATAM